MKWKAKKQQDHPRLCGEKAVLPSKAPQMAGSPPPMRGKAGTPARGLPADGITPAYAGKSIADFILSAGNWDHPRLCGEKNSSLLLTDCELRITPAYAGKSLYRTKSHKITRDHPRLCGEKENVQSFIIFRNRITPAYAGKS